MSDKTDQEKSVILARVMGWHVASSEHRNRHGTLMVFHSGDNEPILSTAIVVKEKEPEFFNKYCPNLYEPQNMALAWRVLNWAAADSDRLGIVDSCQEDGFMEYIADFWELPPADAQRQWLDKIYQELSHRGLVK